MATKKKLPLLKLICKLKKPYISDDGDFVPAGTSVSVLCWDQEKYGRITVKSDVYMYADDLGGEGDKITPVIGQGLVFSVKPSTLTYEEHFRCPE